MKRIQERHTLKVVKALTKEIEFLLAGRNSGLPQRAKNKSWALTQGRTLISKLESRA